MFEKFSPQNQLKPASWHIIFTLRSGIISEINTYICASYDTSAR